MSFKDKGEWIIDIASGDATHQVAHSFVEVVAGDELLHLFLAVALFNIAF